MSHTNEKVAILLQLLSCCYVLLFFLQNKNTKSQSWCFFGGYFVFYNLWWNQMQNTFISEKLILFNSKFLFHSNNSLVI